jgi:ParB family chromosome partitioning protein
MSTLDFLNSLAAPTAQIVSLDIDLIDFDSKQPRKEFYPVDGVIAPEVLQALEELADNVNAVGLLQPILVMPKDDGRYQLAIGERRLRAFRLNRERGLPNSSEIPAIVSNGFTPSQRKLAQLAENLQRSDLSDRETAMFVRDTLEEFPELQKQQIAKIMNKDAQYVSRILALLKPEWADVVETGIITYASLLEQYRALPKDKQTALRETAQREKRPLTSGDIRAAKKGPLGQPPAVPREAGQQIDPDLAARVQAFVDAQAPQNEQYEPSAEAVRGPVRSRQIKDTGGDAVIPSGMAALNSSLLEKREMRLTLQQVETLLNRGALANKKHQVSVMLPVEELRDAIKLLGGEIPEDDNQLSMVLTEEINRAAKR